MIQLTPQSRIFIAIEPVDFRKGIDGLTSVCRYQLSQDPFSGSIFVFRNRSRTTLRCLMYDGQGYWLCTKRLSKGRLTWWPTSPMACTSMTARELQILLWNGNPTQAQMAEDWRKVAA